MRGLWLAGLAALVTAGCGVQVTPRTEPGGEPASTTRRVEPRDVTGEDLCTFVSESTIAAHTGATRTSPSTPRASTTSKRARCEWAGGDVSAVVAEVAADIPATGDAVAAARKNLDELRSRYERRAEEGTTYAEPRDLTGIGDEAFTQYGTGGELWLAFRVGVWRAELRFLGSDAMTVLSAFATEIAGELADDTGMGPGGWLCALLSETTARRYLPDVTTDDRVIRSGARTTECEWSSSRRDGDRVEVRGLSARVVEYGARGEAIFAEARKVASDAHAAGPTPEGTTSGAVRDVPGLGAAAFVQVVGDAGLRAGAADHATVRVLLGDGRIAEITYNGFDTEQPPLGRRQRADKDEALTEEHLVAAVTAAAEDIVPGLG